jgi:AraC-like DNA-binding protein
VTGRQQKEPAASRWLAEPKRSAISSVSLVSEVDAYERTVAGIEVRSIRTGQGHGPNIVTVVNDAGFTATGVTAQFPTMGRTTLPDDRVVLTVFTSTPEGSTWCGVRVEPGTCLLYHPASEHAGVNPEGLSFAFASLELSKLEAVADDLQANLAKPRNGVVEVVEPSRKSQRAGVALTEIMAGAMAGIRVDSLHRDRLLSEVVGLLSRGPTQAVGSTRRIDDRYLVLMCLEYAESVCRIPSMRELCVETHTSERRLRSAFTSVCEAPPSQVLRAWALTEARKRLKQFQGGEVIADVAGELGFTNPGRFSAYYRSQFGEYPSQTRTHERAMRVLN